MFVNSRTLVSLGAALLCGAAAAVETITVDRVRQRTPWNGLVDVDYTVDGVTGDPNDYQIEFLVTTGAVTFVASNFTDAAWCDHQTTNGRWRATWNARADGLAAQVPVGVRARLVYAPVTDASAEFAIVDLSSGGNSSHYPVRYVAGDTNRTAQFNIDVYKTQKIVFKKVHAGEFWMGEGNVSSGSNRHRVRLTKDYFLGLFQISQAQYNNICSGSTGGLGWYKPGFAESGYYATGERQSYMPANCIFYDKIMSGKEENVGDYTQTHALMKKLNDRTKCRGQSVGTFNLPTEAQWEYACRAGTETAYFWGDDSAEWPAYGWCSSGGFVFHEVGLLLPNDWGFYDMLGNVQEWCYDYYGAYPAYSETEVTVDPAGPESAPKRAIRGGSAWQGVASGGSGVRNSYAPDKSDMVHYGGNFGRSWGFRVCLGLR